MDDIYLVEIRLGRTKWQIREAVFTIARLFDIESFIERHPHITLFGPLTLNDGVGSEQLLDFIGRAASAADPVRFTIDGWEKREGMSGSVIAFRVRPSEELRHLTASIAAGVSPFVSSRNKWDSVPESTVWHLGISHHLFSSIFNGGGIDPQKQSAINDRSKYVHDYSYHLIE